jgi:hypothetical protein
VCKRGRSNDEEGDPKPGALRFVLAIIPSLTVMAMLVIGLALSAPHDEIASLSAGDCLCFVTMVAAVNDGMAWKR